MRSVANPRFAVPYDTRAVLGAMPEAASVEREIGKYLADDERAIEDAINAGLRKTVSNLAYGDQVAVASSSFVPLSNAVGVTYEKMHDRSRLEIDLSINGLMYTAGVLVGGVHDGTNTWTVGKAYGASGAYMTPTFHYFIPGSNLEVATIAGLPQGTYTLTARIALQSGGVWSPLSLSTSSLRVTESLW